jgi:hypothetical protein
MHRNTARIMAGGQPVSWLGANFWSRTGGPLMWRSCDLAAHARVRRPAVTLDPFGIMIFSVTGRAPQFPISAEPQ